MAPPQLAIDVKDLHFAYGAGAVPVLDGLDLSVAQGEIVALLGPNGAGKSTLTHLMLGLLRPGRGTVRLYGGDPSAAVRAGRVGVMLQDTGLMRYVSVRELVTVVAAQYGRESGVAAALASAGLTDLGGRRINKLSGGQRQRVKLALAIVGDPELLFLDEPTVSMDVEARHAFWVTVRELAARGRTILFATHYLEEAEANAGRVVVLHGGRIAADGSAADIMATSAPEVTLSFVLPGADQAALAALPGVSAVREVPGRTGQSRVELVTTNPDAALYQLYARFRGVTGLDVTRTSLESVLLGLGREEI
jgi:ABC-2 type transport system ATP-binding protein